MYNNLAVGCLSAVFQDDLLYIKSIGVLPTYRNLGIGKGISSGLYEFIFYRNQNDAMDSQRIK